MHLFKWLFCIGLCLLAAPLTSSRAATDEAGVATMTQYFEFLAMDNFTVASDMWTPEAVERSSRFGIQFEGIPIKADCASPVMRNLDIVKNFLQPPIRRYESLPGGKWTRLEFHRVMGRDLIEYSYYAQKRGDWFWIGYPQDYYSEGWKRVESKYFRVRMHPEVEQYVNEAALAAADRFVEAMADTLGIPDEMLNTIGEKKIEYFYCNSDTLVEKITGHRVKGTLDMGSNDIISANFPHFHEITHLLVNIRLQKLPLYTLPIMREGIAVRYGGRWGKQASALLDLGVFLHKEKLVELDSILTMKGFGKDAGADIVYPLAGVFCGYLVDRLGLDGTLDLYLKLSGDFDTVDGWNLGDVQTALVEASGADSWAAFMVDFNDYTENRVEKYRAALPGMASDGKTILKNDRCLVTEDKDWLSFELTATGGEDSIQGNLLFGQDAQLAGQRSSLFADQYGKDAGFEGYRFGMRFDKNEAGLYDYATNQLLAKYIWGITPSDDYLDSEHGKVFIRFRRWLVEGEKPDESSYKLLPL